MKLKYRNILLPLFLSTFYGVLYGQTPQFTVGTYVQVVGTQNLNVRSSAAGTIIGSQSPGSRGKIISGPTTASVGGTSYVWYNVDWQSGVDGWSIQDGMGLITPSAPTLVSPGNNSSPGPVLSNTSQTFSWNSVSNTTRYGLYIRDITTNTLYEYTINAPTTSYTQNLTAAHSYRWNMQAFNGTSGSAFSGTYYFQISGTDNATFVSKTISDGSQVNAGQSFTQTFRMRNSGTTMWTTSTSGYTLNFVSGSQMGAPNYVTLPNSVSPGNEVNISVSMTAPTTPGTYTGYWRMNNPSGIFFGDQVSAQIVVPTNLLSPPILSGPSDGATGVSTTPTFSWSSVTGANRYWLIVSTSLSDLPTDPNATSCPGCVTNGLSGNTGSTTYTPPNPFPYNGTTRTLSPNTTYYWKVQGWNTNGTQGNYSSVRSFTTVCNYLLNPTSASLGSGSASGSFNVTAASGCSWIASTTYSWIHTSSSGSGNGTVSYTVDANTSTSSRTGTITVQGQTFTITQAGVTLLRPTISSISPNSYPPSLTNQTMIIKGNNFQNNCTLTFIPPEGGTIPSTASKLSFISSSQLSYQFNNANDVGTWSVRVNNPDGQSSDYVNFTVPPPDFTVADGFDYPIGSRNKYTEIHDGDGWYVALEFNDTNNSKYHLGEDWNAESGGNSDYGLPVYSIANGTIVFAGAATISGWGNVLIIRHKLPDGTFVESLYGHVASFQKTTGNVVRGEQVATIGDGNGLYSAHLHLELRYSNCPYWGTEGLGYSVTPSPAGWTDPSDFIDKHRPTTSFAYDTYFAEASNNYEIPFNLLKAIAKVESGIDQSAYNPNDGGCGVMQLTGTTKTLAAQLLSVNESQLCENTAEGARLNILGGAAVLRNFVCWSCPRVFNKQDFDNCSQNVPPYSLTAGEKDTLKNSIEVWWWTVARYNGGGADGYITTTNYTFRVWDKIKQMLSNVSYPPLAKISYRNNGELTPTGSTVSFNSSEISSGDDLLYPTPQDLGRSASNGIRWVNGNFNPFVEVTLHKNDGSVLPVEISSFAVFNDQSKILLKWRTETEINNYGFQIERRQINPTSSSWTTVGFVMGNGSSNSPHEYSIIDYYLSPGRYAYRLKQIDWDGSFKYYGSAEVEILAPSTFALEQNYPNPFNPSTLIRYALPSKSVVRLMIFNALGQHVLDLVNSEQDAGYHEVTWQATVSSGIYFYRIEAFAIDNSQKRYIETKKLMVIK